MAAVGLHHSEKRGGGLVGVLDGDLPVDQLPVLHRHRRLHRTTVQRRLMENSTSCLAPQRKAHSGHTARHSTEGSLYLELDAELELGDAGLEGGDGGEGPLVPVHLDVHVRLQPRRDLPQVEPHPRLQR